MDLSKRIGAFLTTTFLAASLIGCDNSHDSKNRRSPEEQIEYLTNLPSVDDGIKSRFEESNEKIKKKPQLKVTELYIEYTPEELKEIADNEIKNSTNNYGDSRLIAVYPNIFIKSMDMEGNSFHNFDSWFYRYETSNDMVVEIAVDMDKEVIKHTYRNLTGATHEAIPSGNIDLREAVEIAFQYPISNSLDQIFWLSSLNNGTNKFAWSLPYNINESVVQVDINSGEIVNNDDLPKLNIKTIGSGVLNNGDISIQPVGYYNDITSGIGSSQYGMTPPFDYTLRYVIKNISNQRLSINTLETIILGYNPIDHTGSRSFTVRGKEDEIVTLFSFADEDFNPLSDSIDVKEISPGIYEYNISPLVVLEPGEGFNYDFRSGSRIWGEAYKSVVNISYGNESETFTSLLKDVPELDIMKKVYGIER